MERFIDSLEAAFIKAIRGNFRALRIVLFQTPRRLGRVAGRVAARLR
jgi:hypothetical protein